MTNVSLSFGTRLIRKAIRKTNTAPALSGVERGLVEGYLKPMLGDGRISINEAKAISSVVRSLKSSGPIIEIGTLFGFSTTIIAVAKDADRQLLTVDSFQWSPLHLSSDNQEAVTEYALADAVKNSNVKIVKSDKDAFFANYKGPAPAMVFIDADHAYLPTLSDIKEAQRLGAEVVCGHDYSPDFPGVVRAVEETGGVAHLTETFWVLKN